MAIGTKELAPAELDTFEDQRLVEELRKAKDIAVQEMQQQAAALGANAIIGVDLDYETIGNGGSMLMVSASGTAVVIE